MSDPVQQFREAIAASQSVVVSGHKGPDGDCIGAALAFKNALEAIGKHVTVLSNDPIPKLTEFLKGAQSVRVVRTDDEAMSVADESSTLGYSWMLASPSAPAERAPALESAATLAVVDHHEIGPNVSGHIRVIDPHASATCYILYNLFPMLGLAIEPPTAECLLTGIITDTGCFRFGNTDRVTLAAAAALMDAGADISKINEQVWSSRPKTQIAMLQRAFQRLHLSMDKRLAVTYITTGDYQDTEAMDEDTEGIASEIARIGTVDVAAVFREAKPGNVRVSVRSRGDIDVAEVCRRFHGGGHKNAAGCTIDASVEEAMDRMIPALEACLV